MLLKMVEKTLRENSYLTMGLKNISSCCSCSMVQTWVMAVFPLDPPLNLMLSQMKIWGTGKYSDTGQPFQCFCKTSFLKEV